MRSFLALTALIAPTLWRLTEAALYTDPSLLPQLRYDFIIIGAGTAGNVLANRLTENATYTVLVVEAGGSDDEVFAIQVPFLDSTLSSDASIIWNYTTTAQTGLFNRSISYPRGRVLGGSSSINYMVWTRGSKDDWDRYADFTEDDGWSWDAMLPYMIKSERLVPPSSGRITTGEIDVSLHGHKGPVNISLASATTPIDGRILETTHDLPQLFPYNLDMNSGDPLGVGYTQSSITSAGRRANSAVSYLRPALERPNLHVLIQTQVTKLVASDTLVNGTAAFTSVEVAKNASSSRIVFQANKEVILSAGAIGTPQILQLSGIGDPDKLRSVGITPLVNLSDVGENLVDQPILGSQWFANSTATNDQITRNATLATELYAQWNASGTGPYADGSPPQLIWTRVSNESTFFNDTFPDPASGPTSPHIEISVENGFISFVQSLPATGNFISMVTIVSSPASRGSVTLASSDPFDFPLIDPGFFTDPIDVDIMVEAIRQSMEFLRTSAWTGYVLQEVSPFAQASTDAELAAYARNYSATENHPVGTARMSSASSSEGVLTPDLRVKGTSGLRVVDASVLPFIPAAHTQASVYAVAERAADIIIGSWA